MKKTLIYILVFVAIILGCNKLDVAPTSFIAANNYYKTLSDANAAVTSVYASLTYDPSDQSLYGRNLYFLTDMGTDYAAAGASAINPNVRAISALSYDASNDRIALAWAQLYRGIDRANIAIDKIPQIATSDTATLTRLVNEAKFIRGLLYFDVVQLWGPAPLVLHEAESLDSNTLNATRAPREIIYKQIINDLTDAQNLPVSYSGSNTGRATSGAAKSLLAKVYLVKKDWANAINYARQVINGNYGYALFPNFYDAFDPSKKNGIEHIFSAQFTKGQAGTGANAGNTFPPCSFNGFVQTETADIVSDTTLFYRVYAENDQRKAGTFSTHYLNQSTNKVFYYTGKPRFRKYVDTTLFASSQSFAAVNFPIIRYADILLVLAEAINEQNGGPTAEAYEAINKVRRRAYRYDINTPGSSADLAGLTQSQFRDTLRKERLLEFVQEGQRWFDLVRWGILVQSIQNVPGKTGVSARDTLYPIPQSQVNLNPTGLWQNPGY
ncbi:Starch-binding associating with outer membrane [Hydrobacter penzbergensis]|uniref:Starch-binding associating with outer membrane n=1 Tax=Hydrobacter penzbergensis TaxID=1235997 RepID=A0A8X8IDT3_9BACT|nr:RagB/SusD family nutrient uptake outer membrane protein [Hydrobacter penzbergensis]SDX19339.1 Starch-binding associating with outer membrane [Hydrobacter penzbergensis]